MTITTPLSPSNAAHKGTTHLLRWKHYPEESGTSVEPTEHDTHQNGTATKETETGNKTWLSINSVNEFFYGFRYVQSLHNGKEMWDVVPLTLDDLLYPEMDDRRMQSCEHAESGSTLFIIIRNYIQKRNGMVALWDVGMDWRVPGQKNPVPDILVLIDVVLKPKREYGVYDRAKYGGTPALAVEFTSRSTRYMDVNEDDPYRSKPRIYENLGVLCYVIVDTIRQVGDKPPPFWGYEMVHGKYQRMQPDQQGRLWIASIGVWLGPYGENLAWFDQDGNRLLGLDEQEQLTEQEKARAEQAQALAEQEAQARMAAEEELRQLKAKLGLLE